MSDTSSIHTQNFLCSLSSHILWGLYDMLTCLDGQIPMLVSCVRCSWTCNAVTVFSWIHARFFACFSCHMKTYECSKGSTCRTHSVLGFWIRSKKIHVCVHIHDQFLPCLSMPHESGVIYMHGSTSHHEISESAQSMHTKRNIFFPDHRERVSNAGALGSCTYEYIDR